MAIESRLSVLMGERKYNIQAVIDRTGLDRTSISNFYHDKLKRVDLNMLDKLCDLFDCEPSDLLRHVKDKNSAK
jgi:putative transcriptional regulator